MGWLTIPLKQKGLQELIQTHNIMESRLQALTRFIHSGFKEIDPGSNRDMIITDMTNDIDKNITRRLVREQRQFSSAIEKCALCTVIDGEISALQRIIKEFRTQDFATDTSTRKELLSEIRNLRGVIKNVKGKLDGLYVALFER